MTLEESIKLTAPEISGTSPIKGTQMRDLYQEVKAMSDYELQIKVAELLKWTHLVRRSDKINLKGLPDKYTGRKTLQKVPDYPTDLNACHEMEKTLMEGQCSVYEDKLHYIWKKGDISCHADGMRCHTTARQRCEAFVVVMSTKNKD